MNDKHDAPTTPGSTAAGTPGPTNPGGAGHPMGTAQDRRDSATEGTPGPMNPGGDAPRTGGAGLADTARSAASDAADAARGMAAEQTERAKAAVAEEVSSVAQALRTASDDLREGSAQERTFAQIADTLADTAEAIRGKDLGEMVHEATEMARRHPMAFIGGAALLGFTAVRFARASRDDVWRRRSGDGRSMAARQGATPRPQPYDPAPRARSMP